MTRRLLPVKALMKSTTSPCSASPRRDRRSQLEAGDPALGALLEGLHVAVREVQAHHLVEERPRLRRREAKTRGPNLGQLSATAQPRQRERRIRARRHEQMQLLWHVVQKEGHRLVNLRRHDRVVVVEHEQPVAAGSPPPHVFELVDDRGDSRGRGRGTQGVQLLGVQVEPDAGKCRPQVGKEPRQRVVALVEGEPGHRHVGVCAARCPVAEQRRLPEASGRGDQGESVTAVQGAVQLLGKPRPRHQPRPRCRREQLGGEHRSGHPRIIGAAPHHDPVVCQGGSRAGAGARCARA